MKKVVLLLILFFSFGFADSALLLKKGWQLIGSTSKIEDMNIFESKNVEQVWQFDANEQKWRGYSPDSMIQKKINDKGYAKILTIESWHGFWIKSKNEWALTFPTDTDKSDENITLKKGWNLISLPINTVVSPHVFDGKTLWKYAKNNQWEFFEKETKENFPTISHITNSDGIWVRSNKDQNISIATDSAKLHNFSNIDEVKAYIKDMLLTNQRPVCGYYPLVRGGGVMMDAAIGVVDEAFGAEKNSLPQAADDASGTNIQEQGVDESDIIKHDDTHIFYVSYDEKEHNKMFVNITTFENIANNSFNPIEKITINGSVDSLYLVDGKLVVLSRYGHDNYKPLDPTPAEKMAINTGADVSSMFVDIYNVSNISDIKKTASFKINGQLNSSRVVDGKLFLVTNFYPFIKRTYPRIYVDVPECKETPVVSQPVYTDQESNMPEFDYKKYAKCYDLYQDEDGRFYRYDYDNPKISYENLLPFVQKDSEKEEILILPETFFAPCKKDQDPTITTVSKIDIANANLEKTSSVLGYNSTVYASKKALYLVSNKYPIFFNFDRFQERSVVYKFLLDDTLAYGASGFVKGRVLNQFSLSEYDDILRIATTEGNSWQNDTVNSLYTLTQQDDALLIYGVLSGLGKEGETIHSVRFIADHAYMVTFKQTDPFYTIDLSNPANPVKAGELKVYGFSSYLHPIDNNHILGIGRDATPDGQIAGLKMELFDISDLSNPTSVDSYSFANSYSYSEMLNNHKALAYRDSDKLLGFSYSTGRGSNSLGVFQIVNNKINAYTPINNPNSYTYYGHDRGLIFDFAAKTYVAYFSNGKIASKLLNDLK
jgi:uncharacterized secreted protein with C-terminal beta-propeller domain